MPSLGAFDQETIDALREENERLKAEIGYSGSPPAGGSWVQRNALLTRERDEAREKMARCVEALGEIRGRSLAAKTHEVGPLEAKGRLTRILELACAALAAVKGGE